MKLFTCKIFFFLLLCLPAFVASAQVTANFTTDVTAGCSPLVVHFTNTSTPMSGSTFSWNLGLGGMPSTGTDASSSYITPGTYTITLTATNGSVTSTHSVTVTVYPSPIVSFTASATNVCPGTTITFTNTSTAGVPGPMVCTWNFGDGFSGTGSPITHTYNTPGTYNLTLSVMNGDSCTAAITMVAYVTVYTPSVPDFSATPSYFCHPPGHAVFTDLSTGTAPFSCVWRFGDGGGSSLTGPSHDYMATGSYTVTLVITDGHGCTDSITRSAYITVADIHASFTGPDTVCVNTMVSFTNTSSPHLYSSWTFGDGGTWSSDPGLHSYTLPGIYPVRLIISDGSCNDTFTRSIVVLPGPAASFTIAPLHPCPPPATLTFTPAAPGGTIISWLYGDGTGGVTASHLYTGRGIYTIKMICVNPLTGCRDTIIKNDTLYDLVPKIYATPIRGCRPLTVNFSADNWTWLPDLLSLHPYPWSIASYSWDFGDGSGLSTSSAPSHTYTAIGTFHVTVTEVTSNGCTVVDTISIHVGAPPVVTFIATPTRACYNHNEIYFTPTIVSGPVDSLAWLFGDGGTGLSTVGGIWHHFARPGIFTVTLIPYYNGCPGAPFTMVNYITIDSPMAIIADSIYCSPAKRVQFKDLSLGDDTHVWSFGDGSSSTLSNPLHDYPLAAVYTATLTTYNTRSGCRDTTTISVDLRRPIPDFTASDTTICAGGSVTFTSTVTGGVASSYSWSSAGTPGTSIAPAYTATFPTAGRYTVTLVITDASGCSETVTKINYVLVAKPVVNFTASPTIGCWPLTVTFTDASTDIPGATLTTFAWTFGDGGSTTGIATTVVHTYTAAGTFSITETVTDNMGCSSNLSLPLVSVWRPHAVFSASTLHACTGDSIHFTNSSAGITTSFWMFGDGGTSTLNSPGHRYTSPGTYTVKLAVTDSHGCTDTATYVNYITVSKPLASFYMSDSVSICPPLMVIFHNTSTGGLFYNWTLGDGSASTLFGPTNLYITIGYDTVRLIVSDVYGCKDTAYGHVNIFGYAGDFTYAPLTGCSPLTVHFYATTLNVPDIIWDFADGNTSSVSYTDTITHVYTLPGAYLPKLILSDNSGCKNSSIGLDTIKVDEVIPGFKTIPNPVCLGDTFKLFDSSKSYFSTITSRNWTFNGTTSALPSPSFFINAVGTYPGTLVVTDGWGCTGTVTENVTVNPPPVITVSADTIICVGDAATLTGYGGVSYTWSPPATLSCTNCNPTHASPTVITTYTVTGKDAIGCTNTDTVSVFLKTQTFSGAIGDTEICAGITVQLWDTGATKFTWFPATGLSNPHIADPLATPMVTTKYTIIAQLAGCLPDTNYVIVYVHPVPAVDAGPDQTLTVGTTAQLNATGSLIHTYFWEDAGTLSCDSCYNPIASTTVTTTYTVTVTSDFGCRNSDTVTIHYFCDKSQIFIPNSFTPNGDGQNDIFYPRGTGISIIKSFRIYNRWGQMLFERSGIKINDASNAWDGSYNGSAPRPDVYVYVIDASCETGEPINIKGDVTIIR